MGSTNAVLAAVADGGPNAAFTQSIAGVQNYSQAMAGVSMTSDATADPRAPAGQRARSAFSCKCNSCVRLDGATIRVRRLTRPLRRRAPGACSPDIDRPTLEL
jgi:hypothetical protein